MKTTKLNPRRVSNKMLLEMILKYLSLSIEDLDPAKKEDFAVINFIHGLSRAIETFSHAAKEIKK